MSDWDETEYSRRKNAFIAEYKKIEPYFSRRELTANLTLRQSYKEILTETYNKLVSYLLPFSLLSVSSRENCIARLEPIFNKLKASFKILLLKYEFGDCPLILIDIENIQENTDDLTQSTHSDATNKYTFWLH